MKSAISLDELNKLFKNYTFTCIVPTVSGIIDTTYIVSTLKKSYILKKYERTIEQKIKNDIKLLGELKLLGLNVPSFIDESAGWYLYEKLQGMQPKAISSYHIQALARFLSKFHIHTYKKSCTLDVVDKKEIGLLLQYAKTHHYSYYKKFDGLGYYKAKNDGLIHGDIFKDNTVFHGTQLGIFDFIDSGCGNFAFECGVIFIGFGVKKYNVYYINLFLNTYNQHAPKKLTKEELLTSITTASKFYGLKRVYSSQKTLSAKKLLPYI